VKDKVLWPRLLSSRGYDIGLKYSFGENDMPLTKTMNESGQSVGHGIRLMPVKLLPRLS
jgi:hypothetical protein